MKFNSLLIYPGNTTHGAWFAEDAEVRFGRHPGSQWRITQVFFTQGDVRQSRPQTWE